MTTKDHKRIRIAIADDHEVYLDGLQFVLTRHGYEVTGRAGNGIELLQHVREQQPDIVLTDIRMPDMDGVEIARIIAGESPHIGVIIISEYCQEYLLDMLLAGVKGYVRKNTSKDEILQAITVVYNKGIYYCDDINSKIARSLEQLHNNAAKCKATVELTEKERVVLHLICEQLPSKAIAAQLKTTLRAVESVRERLFEKTNSQNVAGLAIYAVTRGLYSPR